MIQIQQLGMYFGEKVLFEDVNFNLSLNSRYGVVGANGVGKSTFLKILSGEIPPESGQINIPSDFKIGTLKQNHFEFEHTSILQTCIMGLPILWKALEEKQTILMYEEIDETLGNRLAELEMIIADENGYEIEAHAGEILNGLGIPTHSHESPMSSLSGGYKLRVLLAQCLLSKPEVLLLDEPTNHLDLPSIAWLEKYITEYNGILVVVSHDHHFLNHVSNHIIDFDYETAKLYKGNYEQFIESKELNRLQKEQEISRQEKKKEELEAFITRFKAKATKARQANSKQKIIDKMEDVHIKRSSRVAPNFQFKSNKTSGKMVVNVNEIEQKFGDKTIFQNISFSIPRGEKVAVLGPNGIGKSTLLKLLIQEILVTAGDIELGHEVKYSYFAQNHKELIDSSSTPFEWLYSFAPQESIGTIRGLLGRVLLSGDDVKKKNSSLSGGEAARLLFAKIMLEQANLLILDEPTNHLDIESIEALANALKTFSGTVICVSHDRHFVEQIATSILELQPTKYIFYKGNYTEYLKEYGYDYLERTSQQTSIKSQKKTSQKTVQTKPTSQIDQRKKKKEKNRLEGKIKKLEHEIEILESKLEEYTTKLSDDYKNNYSCKSENQKELNEVLKSQKETEEKLKLKIEQWETCTNDLENLLF